MCICDTCLCRDTYIDVQVGGWGAVFWDIAHLNLDRPFLFFLYLEDKFYNSQKNKKDGELWSGIGTGGKWRDAYSDSRLLV